MHKHQVQMETVDCTRGLCAPRVRCTAVYNWGQYSHCKALHARARLADLLAPVTDRLSVGGCETDLANMLCEGRDMYEHV